MLWAAAGLALLAGLPQLAAAIVAVVMINGGFAFIQEYRADRASDRLRDLLPVTATVIRDGQRAVVPAVELVPGDAVLLEPGDRVSADLTAARADALAADESLLTGESVPRRIEAGDRLYAGTFVVTGTADARVVATGAATRIAAIAALTSRARRPLSPLAKRLHRVVTVIAGIAGVVGACFFTLAMIVGDNLVQGFLLGLGVTVALIPEGLLPTVTLSLAWGARTMAGRHALVKHLESVETLGSVTFICTDKTGTLTRNEMSVVRVWTPAGEAVVDGVGYQPDGVVRTPDGAPAPAALTAAVRDVAYAAVRTSTARVVERDGRWVASGDPTEVAFDVLATRAGAAVDDRAGAPARRYPFDSVRKMSTAVVGDTLYLKGAPESVLSRCRDRQPVAAAVAGAMAAAGLRVLAVARRRLAGPAGGPDADERDLELLGVAGLADPPRPDIAGAVAACRRAGIRLAIVTGDHPATARAVADQVGLLGPDRIAIDGADLPTDDRTLGDLLDRDGVVVARVTPADKLRIAQALQSRGHVVAMTGDGVNDAPALRAADIGVAMGASGSDVAREAADLVLLDDHFATIVNAVELGRTTAANIRRFLTYHLTDNVAELAPFLVWALSGGVFPLAIGVLQVLALDIGTDLLPALALGAEPPNPRTLSGPARTGDLIDRGVLRRAFGVLGPAEVVVSLGAYLAVLLAGGWSGPPAAPPAHLAAVASGTAFAAIVLGQLANAFACRSQTQPVWRLRPDGNRLLLGAVAIELGMLAAFLTVPVIAALLGGAWPNSLGWALAAIAIPVVWAADGLDKQWRRRRAHHGRR